MIFTYKNMVSLEKLSRPDLPEGRFSIFSEGMIPGCIIGEITSVDDPKKINRVRVTCPLLSENNDIPVGDDGWVWVSERYTLNSTSGGSHRPLFVGSQVILLPILGDPRKLILMDCLNSFVDPPSPELDRSQGLHGEQTFGGVYRVSNDTDASQIQAFPHGVVEYISGEGNYTTQTKNGAMLNLMADGTFISSNKASATTLHPDGTTEIRNAALGSAVLDKDGNWVIQSQNQSAVRLGKDAVIEGPRSKLAALTHTISQQLAGPLGQAQNLLREVNGLVETFRDGGDAKEFLQNLSRSADSIKQITNTLPQISTSIEQLSTLFTESELGASLINQANIFLDKEIREVVPKITALVEKSVNAAEIIAELNEILPTKLLERLVPEELRTVLAGLEHNQQAQENFILQMIVGDYESIQNIIEMQLHNALPSVEETINEIIYSIPDWVDPYRLSPTILENVSNRDFSTLLASGAIQPEKLTSHTSSSGVVAGETLESVFLEWGQDLRSLAENILKILPDNLRPLFVRKDIFDLVGVGISPEGNPVQAFLGKTVMKLGDKVIPNLTEGFELGQKIEPLNQLISAAGNVVGMDLPNILPSVQESVNQIVYSIPDWVDRNLVTPDILESFLNNNFSVFLASGAVNSDQLSLYGSSAGIVAGDTLESIFMAWGEELRSLTEDFLSNLPDNIRPQFTTRDIFDLVGVAISSEGNLSQSFQDKAVVKLGNPTILNPLISAIQNQDFTEAIAQANIWDELGGIIEGEDIIGDTIVRAVSNVLSPIKKSLLNAQKEALNFIGALSSNAKGGILRVSANLVEAAASQYFPSAKMLITGGKASLVAASGIAEIFAEGGRVGFASPYGRFGIGAGGGSWISQGIMAMRVAQDIGKTAGMILHPSAGVSLASFADSNFGENPSNWGNKTAEITVDEGWVRIRSHLNPYDGHGIDVTPEGVFIEGYRVYDFLNRFESRFALIESQLASFPASS